MKSKILSLVFFCVVAMGYSQNVTVQGTVNEGTDMPLPGVSILIKGTSTGTATDFDGNFVLEDVPISSVLVFSYVGFQDYEVVVENDTPLNITLQEDAEALVPGEWTEVRILLMPFAHVFSAGSRIRISVDTPGASRAEWTFILADLDDQVRHSVAHSRERPSGVVFPIVSGIDVPTERAACNALRGQPCRDYIPFENTAE